ncbi:Rogdi, partial [Caligus rogercresseyi]
GISAPASRRPCSELLCSKLEVDFRCLSYNHRQRGFQIQSLSGGVRHPLGQRRSSPTHRRTPNGSTAEGQ